MGLLQPTVGPLQEMGYVTEAIVLVGGAGDRAAAGIVLQALQQLIADLLPGVYEDDVRAFWIEANPTDYPGDSSGDSEDSGSGADSEDNALPETWVSLRLRVEVNTRVFGTEYVVRMLGAILNQSASHLSKQTSLILHTHVLQQPTAGKDLQCRNPFFQGGRPRMRVKHTRCMGSAVLRCLTRAQCPTLSCAEDEIEYRSQYPSVRRCCAVCLRRKLGRRGERKGPGWRCCLSSDFIIEGGYHKRICDMKCPLGAEYFQKEVEAYQQATLHWREAQAQQDDDFLNVDVPRHAKALADFEADFMTFKRDAVEWDSAWRSYTANESLFYGLTCP